MVVAQKLYEQGFITYMRTDSTHLSSEALNASKTFIKESFGNEFLSDKTNVFKNKVANAQEAHEAIRPAHRIFKSVSEVESITNKEAANLYDLIWKRTIASQMKPAKLKQTSITIMNQKAEFRANGQVIVFPGYMRAYVEGRDNPDRDLANKEKTLPLLQLDDTLDCNRLNTEIHNTKPPARFTEASLIKSLYKKAVNQITAYFIW